MNEITRRLRELGYDAEDDTYFGGQTIMGVNELITQCPLCGGIIEYHDDWADDTSPHGWCDSCEVGIYIESSAR
jgi:hypothetical protein